MFEKEKELVGKFEEFGLLETFDKLYENKDEVHTNVLRLVKDERVIKLAISQLKYCHKNESEIVKEIQNLQPKTMKDGVVLETFKHCLWLVLEPICEKHFSEHSYGGRNCCRVENFMGEAMRMVNIGKNYNVVKVDYKGITETIKPCKLNQLLWKLGIQDKALFPFITKIVKSKNLGCLKNLFTNVYLNEIDNRIYEQWEGYATDLKGRGWKTNIPKPRYTKTGQRHLGSEYAVLRKYTTMKEMYFVRYNNVLLVFTKKPEDMERIKYSLINYTRKQFNFELNESSIECKNLKKKSVSFLGFKLNVTRKGNKYVAETHLTDLSMEYIITMHRQNIKKMKKTLNSYEYNNFIEQVHSYFRIATMVNLDFDKIRFRTNKCFYNQLHAITTKTTLTKQSKYYKFYGLSNEVYKLKKLDQVVLPIGYVQTRNAMNKSRGFTLYTPKGREILNKY